MKIFVTDRDGKEHEVEATDGWRVMEVIRDAGLDISAECGGACACATCHVYVDPAWMDKIEPRGEEENDMLDLAQMRRGKFRRTLSNFNIYDVLQEVVDVQKLKAELLG